MKSSEEIRRAISIRAICIALFVGIVQMIQAQELTRTRTYNIHDGLPSNYISKIVQDEQGVIWVATWNGIAAYDGYRFIDYRDHEGILGSNRIFNIYPGTDGLIWILTYDMKPVYLDSRRGIYHDVSKMIPNIVKARGILPDGDKVWILGDTVAWRIENGRADSLHTRLYRVYTDAAGNEWLHTFEGLKKYGTDLNIHDGFSHTVETNGSVYHASRRGRIYKDDNPVPVAVIEGTNEVKSLVTAGKNILVCATDKGIYTYHTHTKQLRKTSGAASMCSASLHIDSDGRIWAIMPGGTIAMAPSAASRFDIVPGSDTTAESTVMGSDIFIEDRYGTLWLAAKDGPLCYYDEDAGTLVNHPIRSRLLNNAVIPKGEIAHIDNQGNLWLSPMHNLSLVNFCNSSLREADLFDNDPTRSVAIARDSTVWLGTTGGIIGRYDNRGNILGYVVPSANNRYSISARPEVFAQRIYAMLADSRGNMWIGTKGNGIYVLAPDGTMSTYRHNPDDNSSIPDDNIYDLDEDSRGNIWGASYGGGVFMLLAAENETGLRTFISKDNGLASTPNGRCLKARRITHTNDGTIIASCTDGLLVFSNDFSHPEEAEFQVYAHDPADAASMPTSHIMHTLAGADGTVYIAPLGDRIFKARVNDLLAGNPTFLPLAERQTHPFLDGTSRGGNVISMVESRDGRIFIILETCVIAYTPATAGTVSIGYNDFDRMLEFTEAAAAIDPHTGALWAPTARGALIVDPQKAVTTKYTPEIAITGTVNDNGTRRNALNPEAIILPAGENTVSLTVAALDYSNNELIQYAYRLDDADEWTYIGNTNTLSIGGLSHGHHTLALRSTNSDGIWCDNTRTMHIHVTPTFWESTPGRLCLCLLCLVPLCLAIMLFRAYRRHLRTAAEHRKVHDFLIGFINGGRHRQQDKVQQDENAPEPADDGTSADTAMLAKLTEYIEQHIGDENLRVEDMAEAVGMGRTAFYNRLKTLVDLTPADFVRRLRMQRACSLIKDNNLTFSEIAYMVGYSDPKYFTRCFKKETGMTPSEYRNSEK